MSNSKYSLFDKLIYPDEFVEENCSDIILLDNEPQGSQVEPQVEPMVPEIVEIKEEYFDSPIIHLKPLCKPEKMVSEGFLNASLN